MSSSKGDKEHQCEFSITLQSIKATFFSLAASEFSVVPLSSSQPRLNRTEHPLLLINA